MTTTIHPYAQILHAIADGQTIQLRDLHKDIWYDCRPDPVLAMIGRGEYAQQGIRVKPRTININGHEVPEPARVAPEPDEPFWLPAILSGDSETTSARRWTGTHGCYRWLQQGLIHLTKEAASAHAAALISFTDTTTP